MHAPDPAASDLLVVKPTPLNAESPPQAFADEITPDALVYVRSNFPRPELDRQGHRIAVGGAVQTPFEIAATELHAMPQHTIVATMECAGNDRIGLRPLPEGEPWRSGAVSTSRWTGVPLAALLARAGVAPAVAEILVEGADSGPREDADGAVRFGRSLPPADALHPDTLLALEMNGAPLAPWHGAPVRLVVPGWYGMASVKWVARIEALAAPYRGYFQSKRYVYEDASGARPVARMRVKSMIVSPRDGEVIARRATVWGWAWSGVAPIARVEVACDGGDAWRAARLFAPASEHAWVRWSIECEIGAPGRHALRCRATDVAGNVQPDAVAWNRLGYGNNAVRAITVDVR